MRWTAVALVLACAAVALVAAGCGDSASVNKDPATSLIEGAGLEICSQDERTGQFSDFEGLVESRIFVVAENCDDADKAKPDTVVFATFNSSQNAQAAEKKFSKAYPGGVTFREKGIAVAVTGPNAKAIAAKLQQELASPTETTDS